MPISEKNAIRALKEVGLDQPGPIRADVKAELVVKAARLAEYYDRMEAQMGADWDDLTGVGEMITARLQARRCGKTAQPVLPKPGYSFWVDPFRKP